jgi:hypothetical protein
MSSILGAAVLGDLPRIQELLKERPERITERDEWGSTALLNAAISGLFKTVK